MPPVVVATSPQGARDILARGGEHIEKTRVHHEMRQLLGSHLFALTHEPWLPRRRALQPIFTKQHVHEFCGHMAQAVQTVADSWVDGTEVDDEQAFPLHLVVAVNQTLHEGVGHSGRIGQRSELPIAFRGECCGSAVRQTQRQGDCERRYREKR
jgi:hypothetical protein